MQSQWQPAGSWGTNVLVAVGVVATILMAFLLAASDDLQMRLSPPRPTQVAAVTGDDATPTFTAIPPTVVLPTETATGIPASATATAEKKPSATPLAVRATCGVIPEDWVAYDVKPGDTLFRLAVNSGATVSALTVANCLDSTRLYAGMTLHLPLEPPPPPPICSGPPSDWVRYAVQRGDTLFSLARTHGSTVYGVMSANCMVSTRINAGQIIYLPASAPAPTATATDAPPPPPPPTDPPPPPPTEPPPPTATNPPQPTATELPPPTATEPPSPTATATPPTATSPPPTATATPPPPDEDPTPPLPSPTAPPPTSTPPPNATATATSEPPPTATGTRLPPDDEVTATPPLPDP
ncbi:MAG: LysM peptidoglycan-binding domain-containing protein [Chloroflexota bacterium]